MNKILSIIVLPAATLLSVLSFTAYAQGVIVKPGANIKFSGSPYFVMPAGDFTNSGTYTKAGETFKFSGAGTHEIKGSQTTNFNNLTIAAGTTLHLPPGQNTTVSGTLVNNGGVAALVIMSDATGSGSLLHNTTGVNGTIERYIPQRSDALHGWHFLSSPVSAQNIQPEFVTITPPTINEAFFSWSEPLMLWINSKDVSGNWAAGFETTFFVGKGYLVNYPTYMTKHFTGLLNVGDVATTGLTKTAGTYTGWNFIGNPFSSALTWHTGWSLTNIAAVAKIWNGSGASYSDINPGGIIPATQGVMVQVTSAPGSVTIPAAARTHSSQSWYKSTGDPLIKLKANDVVAQTFQESVITFNPASTIGYDSEFDAYFLAGYAPQFYSVEGGENLSTNVLPNEDSQTTIPLSFIKTEGADYTIEAMKIENITSQVYLTDLKLNQTQNLSENPVYSFTSLSTDDPARFLISFKPLGIETKPGENSGIYANDRTIYISNPGESTVEIFNMIGQKIIVEKTHNEPLYTLISIAATGYYLVRLTNGQKVITQKVFVK
jgi:hypothetical protein